MHCGVTGRRRYQRREGSMVRKAVILTISRSSATTLPQHNPLSTGFPQVRSRAASLQIICSESPS